MARISLEVLEEIVITLEDLSQTDVELRTDYSGRAMYGDQCVGFVGDFSAFDLGVAVAKTLLPSDYYDDDSAVLEDQMAAFHAMVGSCSEDSMGRSSIYYFPSLKVDR